MASQSITQLILFIAALTVAVGVATTLTGAVTDVSNAFESHSDGVVEQLETDVEIISDPGSPDAIYDGTNETVTLLVKNTGGRTITDRESLSVLVDGAYATVSQETVVGSESRWATGTVLRVVVDEQLSSGEHHVKVHINGDEDDIRFYVDS